jgi:ATP-dependent Clp protease ATP-binding subunit ClpA
MRGYNFTERVRKVLTIARDEAVRLHHDTVSPGHMLLGLLRDGGGVASTILERCDVKPDDLVRALDEKLQPGTRQNATGPDLGYTSRAKHVLELAMNEARELNHAYVGTEHLLMGLLREEKNQAAEVLTNAGLTLERARAAMLEILGTEVPVAAGTPRDAGNATAGAFVAPMPERLRRVFASAHSIAGTLGSTELAPVHLALALLRHRDGAGNAVLDALHFDRDAAIASLQQLASREKASEIPPEGTLKIGVAVQRVIDRMEDERRALGSSAPGTQHLLLALLSAAEIASVFAERRIEIAKVRDEVKRMSG